MGVLCMSDCTCIGVSISTDIDVPGNGGVRAVETQRREVVIYMMYLSAEEILIFLLTHTHTWISHMLVT